MVSFGQKKSKEIKVQFSIEQVQSDEGYWMLAIYDKDAKFLSMEPYRAKRQKVGKKKNTVSLKLPEGNYAVALFQDINSNENLERNEKGIPKEPYSFSGDNIFPLRGMPTFELCQIKVNKSNKKFELQLQPGF
jgi:uncharacterized protein (DUF2141 family)